MAQLETITLGGGCFWCVEAVYQNVKGVHTVVSGYAGGNKETANYQLVCAGVTKHAEVIQIQFDPNIVSIDNLLEMFWTAHDPTQLNRQGNDVGPQYRSVIFYHTEAQRIAAEHSIKEVASKVWEEAIVTELRPLDTFYKAEVQHDNYYKKVGNKNPYCTFIITPKVSKFRKKFADHWKE